MRPVLENAFLGRKFIWVLSFMYFLGICVGFVLTQFIAGVKNEDWKWRSKTQLRPRRLKTSMGPRRMKSEDIVKIVFIGSVDFDIPRLNRLCFLYIIVTCLYLSLSAMKIEDINWSSKNGNNAIACVFYLSCDIVWYFSACNYLFLRVLRVLFRCVALGLAC